MSLGKQEGALHILRALTRAAPMLCACALTVWGRQDRWRLSADLNRPGSLASGRDMNPRDPQCWEGLSTGLVRQKSQKSRIYAHFLGTDFTEIDQTRKTPFVCMSSSPLQANAGMAQQTSLRHTSHTGAPVWDPQNHSPATLP